MRLHPRYVVLLVAAVLLVTGGGLALGQFRTAASSTVLDVYTGTVEVAHSGGDFADANDGQILGAGDRVRTGADGEALITFFDGSTLSLDPSSLVSIDELAVQRGGPISIVVMQSAGRTWSSVQKLVHPDSRYEVRTPALAATVRGTAFVVDLEDEDTHTVQTSEGLVRVQAQGRSVDVRAGTRSRVRRGTAPPDAEAAPVPPTRLRLTVQGGAVLGVIDQLGRVCGVGPQGRVQQQVLGCVATLSGDTETIDLARVRPGELRLALAAREAGGRYTLTATGLTRDNETLRVQRGGDLARGDVQVVRLSLDDQGGTLRGAEVGQPLRTNAVPTRTPVPSRSARPPAPGATRTPARPTR